MKRKRRSPEQIIAKLREAESGLSSGQTIGQVCQKPAVSNQTFHRWRNPYGGLKAIDARRPSVSATPCAAYRKFREATVIGSGALGESRRCNRAAITCTTPCSRCTRPRTIRSCAPAARR